MDNDRKQLCERLIKKVFQFAELKASRIQRAERLEQKIASINATPAVEEELKADLRKREREYLRLMRRKINVNLFEKIKMLGKGAFGSVWLVREKSTQKYFAMKQLCKDEMIRRGQVEHCITEKEIMASSVSDWIIRLYYSFQDDLYLYLVMEFAIGGDLMGLLIRVDLFPEPVARFYMSQCCACINEIHKNNSFYRDAKPDNFLISESGHVKLSDFSLAKDFKSRPGTMEVTTMSDEHLGTGSINPLASPTLSPGLSGTASSLRSEATGSITAPSMTVPDNVGIMHNRAYSTVGTLDYSAVEIVRKDPGGYGHKVDWWSMGAILYECVFGYPPFGSDNPRDSVKKIVKYKQYLKFPADPKVSPECIDLIKHLICEPEERYDFEQIKAHPWFANVDWNDLHSYNPPFKPNVSSEVDLKYFDFVNEAKDGGPVEALPECKEQVKWFSPPTFGNYTYRAFPGTVDLRTNANNRTNVKDLFKPPGN
ncbi:Kinase, AGC NDR [Giardia duodenalis]|uniref:non-specific serine/threonine protein kinase n=2 Tax=Giardia intestinalis TaxID=5741 RepID=A8BB37_GIAIC|nr:Kinase, AGC NDR [Giardia intestinalis]ESU39419.1 Serine/threonine protein kinase [Giardia intestinalis]KAE8302089.1 Kinase, AGC NDR [Giardia intestinalis]|eukprot:XP_001708201.1 Kinase, AGC NDR [Giardia lamblia ATCC 50803]